MSTKIYITTAILSFGVAVVGCTNGTDAPPLHDSHSSNSASTSHDGEPSDSQPPDNPPNHAKMNSFEYWLGHWENDNGKFWIVVSHDQDFEIAVSNGRKVTKITHSENYRQLTFVLDDRWTYELILDAENDSQADLSDRDNRDGPGVWGSGTLYKLSRSSSDDSR